jgi:hypothetical protein
MRKLWAAAIVLALTIASSARATPDFAALLQEADRVARLTDWYSALPIYAEVEQSAAKAGNRRDALYAKFGRLRGQMQTLFLPDISEQIAADLESPLSRRDARLRPCGFTVERDLEWDVLAAERDWEEARHVAKELGDTGCKNRANRGPGMIAFLRGNTEQETEMVQKALQIAMQSGDIGGQLRYTGNIANGLLLAGYAPRAMDRALKFGGEHIEHRDVRRRRTWRRRERVVHPVLLRRPVGASTTRGAAPGLPPAVRGASRTTSVAQPSATWSAPVSPNAWR